MPGVIYVILDFVRVATLKNVDSKISLNTFYRNKDILAALSIIITIKDIIAIIAQVIFSLF